MQDIVESKSPEEWSAKSKAEIETAVNIERNRLAVTFSNEFIQVSETEFLGVA